MIRKQEFYKENDNVYLNVILQGNSELSQLEYNVTKTSPIVNKGNEYYLSVVKFDIPLGSLPITICPVIPNQPNPNLTTLKIGISYNNVDYTQNVIWESQNINLSPPNQNQQQQIVTPYYDCYNYEWMINIINKALELAYIASGISALYVLPLLPPKAPYFYYDQETELINLIVPRIFHDITGSPLVALPQIYVNYNSFQFLDNFNWETLSLSADKSSILKLNYLKDYDGYALYGTNPTNPPSYYEVKQSFTGCYNWTSLRKIIITTGSIPISSEYVPSTGNGSVNSSQQIITDFTPAFSRAQDPRSIAYYVPTAQYRLTDIISDNPIYKIDLKVFWEDIQGNVLPLLIPSFEQANIKIAFVRKTLYKNVL